MYGNVDTPGFINIPHYILFSIYHLAQYWNKQCIDDMVYMIFLWERWALAGFSYHWRFRLCVRFVYVYIMVCDTDFWIDI